jgi:hypothetical protein
MKPRRWYSSPEHNPDPRPRSFEAFPESVYWSYTARTRLDQGGVIKATPAEAAGGAQRRRAAPQVPRPPRLIDAA